MITRNKHPNKEIENSIRKAEQFGWRYQKAGGSAHAWGHLLCPLNERGGCRMSIWSTPRNADNHARQILKQIQKCPHMGEKI